MRPIDVRMLIAVSEAGSIRSAAKLLGKSQSALTRGLKQLEDEAGLALFRRTSRGVVPTEVGLSLLARARSVQAEMQRFDQEVSELRGHPTGSVRVSVSPLAAVKILPRAIGQFREAYPNIDIKLSSDLFGDALKALREGQQDIMVGPYAEAMDLNDVSCETLLTTEIVVITSRRAAHAKATSLRDLTGCFWAMMGYGTGAPRHRFVQQFARHGLEAPRIRLASESRLGLLALVEELDAVCTFPLRLLEELGPSHKVVRIPVEEELLPLTVSMITRNGQSLTPAGERLAECIRQEADTVAHDWAEQGVG